MMQPSPLAAPAIDAQQEQQVFLPQQPEPQLVAQQYPQQVSSADEIRTLWIGGLQQWMDETYLHDCFSYTKDLLSLKIIRNKQTGESEGYGFLEFASHAAAQMALQNYNGEQFYRLNWATFGIRQKRPEDYTIFVGDLAYDVKDDMLQETFRAIYPSVKGAKVITDTATGRSKSYGFVDFRNVKEQLRSMTEMNGMPCSSRPMRIGPAVTKKNTFYQQPYPIVVGSASANDSNNTTLFVASYQQQDPNQWNGDVQGYSAAYSAGYGYGYVTQPQDPNMYSYIQTISNRIQTINNKIQTCTVVTLQMQTISNKIQQIQTIRNNIQTISNKIQLCTVITLQMQTISNSKSV